MMKPRKDETGNKYGLLTVIEVAGMKYRRYWWRCVCECGNESIVDGNHLRTGHTTSCGCRKSVRHGYCYTSEYTSWLDMKSRCNNPNSAVYKDYGGRGISVCPRWTKFKNFIADMGDKPALEYTLERIDNDGNYEPQNCTWATRARQMRNRRNNHKITFQGRTMCLVDWASELGISATTLYTRIKRGWSIERAITTPVS